MGALVLQDKYVLLRRLGVGGMAEVFLARQLGLSGFSKLVVIKRTLSELARNREMREMFLDEARTAADLRHPNVVDLYEVAEDAGRPFLVMELLHGRDLGHMLARASRAHRPIPIGVTLQVGIGIASGLHYAHRKRDHAGRALGIVHRDISPQNVIVTYNGEVKIVDFGIAKAASQNHRSEAGEVRGKVSYLSPEQILGGVVDGRADQYALGVVLYELSTRQPLFRRETTMASIEAIVEEDITPPSAKVAGYPPELEQVVMRMLATGPDERFEDCRAVADELEEILERYGVRASRRRLGRYMRRTFADELEDEQTLAEMPTLGALPSTPSPEGSTGGGSGADDASDEEVWATDTLPVLDEEDTAPIEVRPQAGAVLTNTFVPRDEELERIRAVVMGTGPGLVTLVGPAGVGKSRLAREFVSALLDDQDAADAWYVDVSELDTSDALVNAVAAQLHLSLEHAEVPLGERVDRVGRALDARTLFDDEAVGAPSVLWLDGFDAVRELAKPVVERWGSLAPRLRMLVTSRAALGHSAETVVAVAPLTVPSPDERDETRVLDSEAVQLFIERARAVRPDFALASEDARVVAHIVRTLDGIPLAIELAAARMGTLTPARLEAQLSHRFDVLKTTPGHFGAGPSLRGAIDLSWDLLEPREQRALAWCSVFSGGFDLAAAEAVLAPVLDGPPSERRDAALVLAGLHEMSLLRLDDDPGLQGELRFVMYETLRAYAAEKLVHLGELDDAHARHAAHYVGRVGGWARTLDGPGAGALLRRIGREEANLADIVARALAADEDDAAAAGLALAGVMAMDPVLAARGYTSDDVLRLEAALRRAEAAYVERPAAVDGALLSTAFEVRGDVYKNRGLLEDARADYERAVAVAIESDAVLEEGIALRNLAGVRQDLGDFEGAVDACKAALARFRQVGDRHHEARVRVTLAQLREERDQHDKALVELEQALDTFRTVGDRRFEGRCLSLLGRVHLGLEHDVTAYDLYQRALVVLREMGELREEGRVLLELGLLQRGRGDFTSASGCLRQARARLRRAGDLRGEGRAAYEAGRLSARAGAVEDAAHLFADARVLQLDCGDDVGARASAEAARALAAAQEAR